MTLLADMTTPYSAAEAWIYDRFVAPAIVEYADSFAFSPAPGSRVIDVGCGGGQVLAALVARHAGIAFEGVDLSPHQAERARRRSGVPVAVGDAMDLPFDDDTFDGVLSVASIKHWPDPRRGLAECRRIAKPGARVFVVEVDRACTFDDTVSFVNRWRIPRLLRSVALAGFRTWVAGRSFDRDEFVAMARSAGLVDVTVDRVDGAPALVLDAQAPA